MMKADKEVSGSFRDPSGFLFYHNGEIYRQVKYCYKENYDKLLHSGLYDELVAQEILISHSEVEKEYNTRTAYKTIKPEWVPFISYPYEWSFSQLKNAALATLKIQKKSLRFDLSLKDASAYNIQFIKNKPVLIDSLSFEQYREGEPWIAYRQFCQHFLAPLALMSFRDIRLNQLLRLYIDGIPLDLASGLLPLRTYFCFPLLIHIHLHAGSQKKFSNGIKKGNHRKVSKQALYGIIDSLETAIKKMAWHGKNSIWRDYYDSTNYSDNATAHKQNVISEILEKVHPKNIWDLGANTGRFSHIAADKGIDTISFDFDPAVVEKMYLRCIEKNDKKIFPIVIDLTNPSPGIGWENQERMSLIERGPVDLVFALALIHHLSISNNVPFTKLASFFYKICRWLVIEFVPKSDSQVKRLLLFREDIFSEYSQEKFEEEFSKYFLITHHVNIEESDRIIYLMEKRGQVNE